MDTNVIRAQFPIFKKHPNYIYLDNAATTQKPLSVLNAVNEYYFHHNANAGRGSHDLVRESTQDYEDSRRKVAEFIHAQFTDEIVFTSGTTDGINQLARMLTDQIEPFDVIAATITDHHSNFLPWQNLSREKNAQFKVITLTPDYDLDFQNLFDEANIKKLRVVTLPLISNVIGRINPIQQIIEQIKSHSPQTLVIVDAAQAVAHEYINVKRMNCDALVFSGHKMYGPQGIGVLYLKKDIARKLIPTNIGGGMVESVSPDGYQLASIPHRFEAGTVDVAGAVGLKAAITFIDSIGGVEEIRKHEQQLIDYLTQNLFNKIPQGLYLYTNSKQINQQGGLVSLSIDGIDCVDLGNFLNDDQIFVRTGNQCAVPIHTHLQTEETLRVSVGIYNQTNEIDQLISSIMRGITILKA